MIFVQLAELAAKQFRREICEVGGGKEPSRSECQQVFPRTQRLQEHVRQPGATDQNRSREKFSERSAQLLFFCTERIGYCAVTNLVAIVQERARMK